MRLVEDMHAVYIRLERPRQKLWPVRRPEQQIAPGRPGITEGKFLCAKKQAHAEKVRGAEDGLLCDGVTFDSLLAQALRDQGKRDPRKKNEERRRQGSPQLRPNDQRRRFS